MGDVDSVGLGTVPSLAGVDTSATEVCRSETSWVSILTPRESLIRVKEQLKVVYDFRPRHDTNFCALSVLHGVFITALAAHIEVLEHLKDAPQVCDVVWNEKTGFPSEGTLLADAAWLGRMREGKAGALLQSFGNWSFWSEETVGCACGRMRKFREENGKKKLKEDKVSILIHHDLGLASDSTLLLRENAAVQCERVGHLRHYLESEKAKRVSSNTFAVSFTEATLGFENGSFGMEIVRNDGVNEELEFARTEFHREVLRFLEQYQKEARRWLG